MKSVSWIRKEDSHIVTVDRYTFIADDRFQVMAAPPGDSWMLQIKYVQPRDAGFFECQISTEPKMAHRIRLNVLVPKIRMDTTEENMFVWEGSQVQLRCVVMNTLADNVGKVIWLRNGKILNKFDLSTSSTMLSFQAKLDGTKLTETLTFVGVQKSDGGNYTCSLENVGFSSVTLHVLSGENPAAMHHGRGITTTTSSQATTNFHQRHLNHNYHQNSFVTIVLMILVQRTLHYVCHR
ncbi:Lachesin [Orchesella cincta]|uniref:Lachesin n=1 Tax=Orchesella cincta TaxID=48709 RepID=A0A1D2NGE3_ORCCI|nr:Lachesin [Orchesella cincta]